MYDLTHEFALAHAQTPAVLDAVLTPARLPIGDLASLREERLPFTVRIARDDASLRKAVSMRQSAYGRHLPELAATLGEPEDSDREPGSLVLVAQARLDGAPLGTMRIQTNQFQPLHLEESAPLPNWLAHCALAEATRLGVVSGPMGKVVKTTLFKAFYQYCLLNGIDWMVITARPPLHRQYQALMFQEVFPDRGVIPMAHVGGIGHHVLALEVGMARPRWQAAGHPLFGFMCQTFHPDLQLHETSGDVTDRLTLPQASDHAHLRDLSFAAEPVAFEPSHYSVAV
ncbi:hypothetical protein PTE30175_00651 [Pandoraea terrae]|uniref:Uncharacterized protein n=1 Tax=Pandoraea terrae TaxID=1537710 RepID=A0A5E4SF72_9BURK|nr:hypothetical protein [Pandoraea terrae]VVD72669.1 hypothetical protein PTE30175_00651 [Pandoraea terrae]